MMDLLATSTLASEPAYAFHIDVGDVSVVPDFMAVVETLPAAPSSFQAREVQARVAALAAEVEQTERHLRAVSGAVPHRLLDGADFDVALRMPRGVVDRRKGRLRMVSARSQLVCPSAEDVVHLQLGDGNDDR